MSIRWRKDGELVCAAKSKVMSDDTYIDDRLQYMLSIILRVIVPDPDEEHNGRWHWILDKEGILEYWRLNP